MSGAKRSYGLWMPREQRKERALFALTPSYKLQPSFTPMTWKLTTRWLTQVSATYLIHITESNQCNCYCLCTWTDITPECLFISLASHVLCNLIVVWICNREWWKYSWWESYQSWISMARSRRECGKRTTDSWSRHDRWDRPASRLFMNKSALVHAITLIDIFAWCFFHSLDELPWP